MDNINIENKKINRLGRVSAIFFIGIASILLFVFLLCMFCSAGSFDEGGSGSIWWLFVLLLWISSIPYVTSVLLSLISLLIYIKDRKKGVEFAKNNKIINIINIINLVIFVIITSIII